MKKKYVLKNRARFALIITLLVLCFVLILYSQVVYGYGEAAFKTVIVKEGDTLWNIALTYGENQDIRKFIYDLKKLNNIEDNTIYPGERLKIPIK